MKSIKLNNNIEMPILGYGVYQIENSKTEECVTNALKTGYRLIDTAASYKNEEGVGRALKNSGISRKELFITTKLWVQDTGYEATKKAFDKSLSRLGLEYLDLYLIHQSYGDYFGSWRAMEELLKEGRVRAIGVSNFYPDRLIDLMLHNEIKPAVNQVETNPYFQQIAAHEIMKEYNVQIESWGPFAEGKNDMFKNEVLADIGSKYNKSIAQVVLRWLIQRDVVVIPKSVSPERMAENLNVFDFELSQLDMERITKMDTGKSQFFDHRDFDMTKMLSGRRDSEI
ncbi:MAG: aldo/keto reductase [Sebaldella sp.]|nr:aldo/keto reductase [Sebaldella sp.]